MNLLYYFKAHGNSVLELELEQELSFQHTSGHGGQDAGAGVVGQAAGGAVDGNGSHCNMDSIQSEFWFDEPVFS